MTWYFGAISLYSVWRSSPSQPVLIMALNFACSMVDFLSFIISQTAHDVTPVVHLFVFLSWPFQQTMSSVHEITRVYSCSTLNMRSCKQVWPFCVISPRPNSSQYETFSRIPSEAHIWYFFFQPWGIDAKRSFRVKLLCRIQDFQGCERINRLTDTADFLSPNLGGNRYLSNCESREWKLPRTPPEKKRRARFKMKTYVGTP